MHCHCGTNNTAPQWTFTDPCKPEVRPSAREKSASPAWQPAVNARDTTRLYIWRFDTGYGPTLYRKCHSHNTPGKRINKFESNPSRGTVLSAPHGKGKKITFLKPMFVIFLCNDAFNITLPYWHGINLQFCVKDYNNRIYALCLSCRTFTTLF